MEGSGKGIVFKASETMANVDVLWKHQIQVHAIAGSQQWTAIQCKGLENDSKPSDIRGVARIKNREDGGKGATRNKGRSKQAAPVARMPVRQVMCVYGYCLLEEKLGKLGHFQRRQIGQPIGY